MTKLQNYGVKAGLLIGLAFLIVRLSMARRFQDLMLACGATMIEVALVLFLERKAKEMEPQIAECKEKDSARRSGERALDAGLQELAAKEEGVADVLQQQQRIEQEQAMNAALTDEKKLIAIAVGAARGGYMEGLVERRVRTRNRPKEISGHDQGQKEEAA